MLFCLSLLLNSQHTEHAFIGLSLSLGGNFEPSCDNSAYFVDNYNRMRNFIKASVSKGVLCLLTIKFKIKDLI